MFAALFMSSILLGLSSSSPIANFWLNSLPASLAPLNQYHAQDGSGSYRYGYTGPHHAKMETRSNGVTQGGYSYIDANGILQTVAYSADAENGFRVRASNLPQPPPLDNSLAGVSETPEVAAARKSHLDQFTKVEKNLGEESSGKTLSAWQHLQASQSTPIAFSSDYSEHSQVQRDTSVNEAKETQRQVSELRNPFLLSGAEASRIEIPKPDLSLLKAAEKEAANAKNEQSYSRYENVDNLKVVPLPNVHRTLVAPSTSYVVPVVPYRLLHSSLHHTQDSLGQYDYSYVGDTSSKTESRSLDGTTRGAYSYVDANGLLQQVHYIADHNGFRVVATNLPEA